MDYISTYISGFSDIVEKYLPQILKDAQIHFVADGLIYYSSDKRSSIIAQNRMFNNTFLVLSHISINSTSSPGKISNMLTTRAQWNRLLELPGSTFRFFVSFEGELVSIQKSIRSDIGSKIKEKTNLEPSSLKADHEFWFIIRRDGHAFFCLRISDLKKKLEKGELRPELAHALITLAEPKSSDAILDPFAGHGTIPGEVAKSFPYKKLILSDNNKVVYGNLATKFKNENTISSFYQEAHHLKHIEDESVDKIVTDPPWGFYKDVQVDKLYPDMLGEFERVLIDHGTLILLTAQKDAFENALSINKKFQLVEKYDILVSGKKAAIYKLVKH